MASYMTNKGKYLLVNDATTASVWRIMLVDTPPANSGAAADLNTVSQVVGDELSGTGYVRQTVNTQTVTEDDTNDYVKVDATDPATYTGIDAGTIAGAWIYKRVGGGDVDANDLLICFLDCTDLVTNGGDVTLSYHATNGILTGG